MAKAPELGINDSGVFFNPKRKTPSASERRGGLAEVLG
jgi:hypothetical protein